MSDLQLLRNDTLLEADFENVSDLVSRSFDAIEGASQRRDGVAVYTSVATSKILNAAVNPELFVIWDNAIQDGYRIGNGGYTYANIFLPKMQGLAHQAIKELMRVEDLSYGDALHFLQIAARARAVSPKLWTNTTMQNLLYGIQSFSVWINRNTDLLTNRKTDKLAC